MKASTTYTITLTDEEMLAMFGGFSGESGDAARATKQQEFLAALERHWRHE